MSRENPRWARVWTLGPDCSFFPQQENAALWPGAKIIWESLMRRAEQQLTRVRVAIIRCGSPPPPSTPKMLPLTSSSRFSHYSRRLPAARVCLSVRVLCVCVRGVAGRFREVSSPCVLCCKSPADRSGVLGRVLKCLKRSTFLKMSSGRNRNFVS